MRKLFILRGAMASGKTTFIKEHNLEMYTLSSDNLRLMFNSPEITINYQEKIPQFNNEKVWQLLYTILEERMKKGELTFIDAVHAYSNISFPIYKKLAEKYRYRTYIIDFTNVSQEEAIKRNQAREEEKRVPTSSIERVYRAFKKEKISSSFKVIKPTEFSQTITTIPRDLNSYENIHIIGDIHGSATALKTYFKEFPIKPNDFYIFTGDYFDRGLENYQTFKFLLGLMNNKNIQFLIGNHEDKLYKYACDDEFKMDYNIKNTILELENNQVTKSEIRMFIKNLSQLAYINFNNKTYLITHGGIPYIPSKPLDFYSTNTFIYGIDSYEVDIDQVYNDFMENQTTKIYQIHGHRNYYHHAIAKYPYSFNLDGDIEHGGYLRILTLNKSNYECLEIKNDVYDSNLDDKNNIYNLINDLRNNKYVYEKELGCNISSFNFTKEAFYHQIWSNITTKARGLFIDTKNYQIVARSYNKFFKVENFEELSFPVNFYLKYNGFLGIVSVYNDELFLASKSTNTGDYVTYFKDIFYKQFTSEQIDALKEKLRQENLTAVFEVIDPVNDPHIIKYSQSQIILLDMIYKKMEFAKLSYKELKKFANNNNILIKELVYEASNLDEFRLIYNKIMADDYQFNNEYVEGFVIEDSNLFMAKTKTKYYDTWKHLRTKMEQALKDNKFKTKSTNELEQRFMNFLKNKYQDKLVNLDETNIIKERTEFIDFDNNI